MSGFRGPIHRDTMSAMIASMVTGVLIGNLTPAPTLSFVLGIAVCIPAALFAFWLLPTADEVARKYDEHQSLQSEDGGRR